jgi:hypothetical protein
MPATPFGAKASAYVRPTPPRTPEVERQYFVLGGYFGLRKIDEPHEEDVGYYKKRAKRDKGVAAG